MDLHLARRWFTPRSTIGQLSANGKDACFILEDPVRHDDPLTAHLDEGAKVPGVTAIPAGRYRVIVSYSPRFRRLLPELLAAPGFTGIRIHPGNGADDTEGCLLPGRTRSVDFVGESRLAFDQLFAWIAQAEDDVWLTITDEPWVRTS